MTGSYNLPFQHFLPNLESQSRTGMPHPQCVLKAPYFWLRLFLPRFFLLTLHRLANLTRPLRSHCQDTSSPSQVPATIPPRGLCICSPLLVNSLLVLDPVYLDVPRCLLLKGQPELCPLVHPLPSTAELGSVCSFMLEHL